MRIWRWVLGLQILVEIVLLWVVLRLGRTDPSLTLIIAVNLIAIGGTIRVIRAKKKRACCS